MNRRIGAVIASLGLLSFAGAPPVAADAVARAAHAPPGGGVVASIAVPADLPGYGGFAVGAGAIWAVSNPLPPSWYVTEVLPSTLTRIDPTTNEVAARIEIPFGASVTAGHGAVWVSHPDGNIVSRIDPRTNAVVATIPVGPVPDGIALSRGAVWVANRDGPSVSRIDPSTNQVLATIRVGPARACCAQHMSVSAVGDSVWVGVPNLNAVVRIDAATNEIVAAIRVPAACGFVTAGTRAAWVAGGRCESVVTRLDARTNRWAGALTAELAPIGLALGFGSLWIADLDAHMISRMDLRTHRVIRRLRVGGSPVRLARGFGSMWAQDDHGRVLRIEP